MREGRSEQSGCEQRADDQPGRLHGKHQRNKHAAVRFAGVLAHNGRGDRLRPAMSRTRSRTVFLAVLAETSRALAANPGMKEHAADLVALFVRSLRI
jgi:hypothetical protein